jgi:methylamine dehydrogenase light chain
MRNAYLREDDVHEFDRLAEQVLRGFASRTSRRGVITLLGSFLAGAGTIPLLPVAKGADGDDSNANDPNSGQEPAQESGNPQDPGDRTKCDYWRYCAIDGTLCACYGGTVTSCPPGAEMSPITWIGTCRNPADQRNYIISYNDCCGGVGAGRCGCENNKGDRPVVRPQTNNEVTWCFGTKSQSYTCTVALILGVAVEKK